MKKILTLKTQNEALRMKSILEENNIPFVLRSYGDSAYGGMFQVQKGWGRLDSDEYYEKEILDLYHQGFKEPIIEEEEGQNGIFDLRLRVSDNKFMYVIIAFLLLLLIFASPGGK